MPFCPHCGGPVDSLPEVAPVAEAVHVDLEIARINAERDVAIARLQARQAREELETAETIAETEAEAEVETAVAVAEILTAEDETEAETGEPIVIEAPEPEPEPEPEMVPPVAETHRAASKSRSWWDGYS